MAVSCQIKYTEGEYEHLIIFFSSQCQVRPVCVRLFSPTISLETRVDWVRQVSIKLYLRMMANFYRKRCDINSWFLVDVEHSHVRFLGNLVLNLWDCGGQESFMEQYFASQKDNIFRNVEVLIYVFDVESRELDNDMHYYQSCLEAIYKVK